MASVPSAVSRCGKSKRKPGGLPVRLITLCRQMPGGEHAILQPGVPPDRDRLEAAFAVLRIMIDRLRQRSQIAHRHVKVQLLSPGPRCARLHTQPESVIPCITSRATRTISESGFASSSGNGPPGRNDDQLAAHADPLEMIDIKRGVLMNDQIRHRISQLFQAGFGDRGVEQPNVGRGRSFFPVRRGPRR